MTYKQLAKKIAELTPDQRNQDVCFLESYDNSSMVEVDYILVALEQIKDENDNVFDIGTVYLC